MWIDIKGDHGQSLKTWRVYNRHIIGCIHGKSADITSRAGAQIWCATTDHLLQSSDQIVSIELIDQNKSIAASNKNGFGILQSFFSSVKLVNTCHRFSHSSICSMDNIG